MRLDFKNKNKKGEKDKYTNIQRMKKSKDRKK